jgi:hypothetical protein
MKVNSQIEVRSDVDHVRQIYAGYALLHKTGFIDLKQIIPDIALENRADSDRWTDYKFFNVKVVINEDVTVLYDLHDRGWIDEDILAGVDLYFKRSFDREYVSGLREGKKVFPLGFNYPVSTSHVDLFKLQRARLYAGREKLKMIAKALRIDRLGIGRGETDILDNLEGEPGLQAEPKILYMARLWDPERLESKEQGDIVREMNDVRAECVRVLRQEFGERFFGGLARDDYSLRNYADCVLADTSLSNKRNYLEIMSGYPICVATTGLSNSNGWKLGEYIAFSKAIITESLRFQVTGDFLPESNYLEFRSPEELVNAATRLFEDADLRREMMENNYRYYQTNVRPDALVRNTLEIALNYAGRDSV